MQKKSTKKTPRHSDALAFGFQQTNFDFQSCPWVFDDAAPPLLVLPIEDHGVQQSPQTPITLLPGETF